MPRPRSPTRISRCCPHGLMCPTSPCASPTRSVPRPSPTASLRLAAMTNSPNASRRCAGHPNIPRHRRNRPRFTFVAYTARRSAEESSAGIRCFVVAPPISVSRPIRARNSRSSCRRRSVCRCPRGRVPDGTASHTCCTPTRNAWIGQSGDDARETTSDGSELAASLCPPNASNTSGRSANNGSSRPACVSVIVTAATGSG